MNSVTSRKTYVFLFWMIFFVIQNCLQQWYAPFQYIDELFAALVIPYFVYRFIKREIIWTFTKRKVWFVILFAIFWLSGWAGHLRYQYQPFMNAAKDSYVNLKFFMAVGCSFLIFEEDELDFKQLKDQIWTVLNLITIVLFVLCIADLSWGISSTKTRVGMRTVMLFYSAYTFLVGECVFLSALYLWFFEEKKKKIIWPLLMLAFVMLSTRRVKAMGVVACILIVYLFVFHKRQTINKKIKILSGIVFAIAAAAGLYQLVSYYYTMGVESARAVLTIGAPFIAMDHFPFGTGWGTYGSAFSGVPYSPVYGMYRMAGVWGMSPDFYDFLSDTFWPMVLGQCGIFGFAAFIGVLILFVKKVFTLKTNKSAFAAALIALLYLFISSSSESAFVSPIAVPLAFLIGILFAEQKVKKSRKQEMVP